MPRIIPKLFPPEFESALAVFEFLELLSLSVESDVVDFVDVDVVAELVGATVALTLLVFGCSSFDPELPAELCDVELEPPDAEAEADSELAESLAEALDESPAEPSLLEEEEDFVAGLVVFLVVGLVVLDVLSLLPESLDEEEDVLFFFLLDELLLVALDESLLDEEDFFFVDVELDLELSSEVPASSSDPVLLSSSSLDVVNIAGHSVVPFGHSPSS